jgi:hypothetical protein
MILQIKRGVVNLMAIAIIGASCGFNPVCLSQSADAEKLATSKADSPDLSQAKWKLLQVNILGIA